MRSLAIGVLLVCGALSASASASAGGGGHLGHAGRWFTDASGRVVVLHGLNMVYKRPPYYPAAVGFGADDAVLLQRLGLNVVRVGVIWKAVEPEPGVYDNAYLNQIAGTVRTLNAHGVLSLLDFHQDMYNELFQGEGAPDWAVQTGGLPNPHSGFPTNYYTDPALQHANDAFWANRPGPGGVGLQDRYAAAWRHVASRFRTVPGMVGYELLNEPSAGAAFTMCLLATGCPTFDSEVVAFHRRVAKAIRAVDGHTLIFYEPDVGFDFGVATHEGALSSGPAAFAFHAYCLADAPNGCSSEPQSFQNALTHVAKTGDAVMMTEFGSKYSAEDRSVVSLADQNMVPWTEWAFCTCGDPTGPTGDPLVVNPAKPPTGANVGPVALHTLVEPFPHLIAGTPSSWGYNPQTKVFRLRYSTAKAGGHGRFAAGAITQIATPRESYARPYAVRVNGGAIVSSPGAPILDIAACPGVRNVSVRVLASGHDRQSCRPRR